MFFEISANLSLIARASGSVFCLINSFHWVCVILPIYFGTNCFFTYFLFMSDFHLWNNCPILINVALFTNSLSMPSGYLIFSVMFLQSCSFVVSDTSCQFHMVMETLSLTWNLQARLNAFLVSGGSIGSPFKSSAVTKVILDDILLQPRSSCFLL
jgi:hypothetical protein